MRMLSIRIDFRALLTLFFYGSLSTQNAVNNVSWKVNFLDTNRHMSRQETVDDRTNLLWKILSTLKDITENDNFLNANRTILHQHLKTDIAFSGIVESDVAKLIKQYYPQYLHNKLKDQSESATMSVLGVHKQQFTNLFPSHKTYDNANRTVAKRLATAKRNRRQKYFMFGVDNRSPVFPFQMRNFPYFNVVRISTGCTGNLLTPSFVLTAAHCVHNGIRFKSKIDKMRLEVPDMMGYKIHYASHISVPVGWIKKKKSRDATRAAYDYAIIKLSLPVPGRREFMKLNVPIDNSLNDQIFFFGFPFDKTAEMWKSKCFADANMVFLRGNLILSQCDSVVGNSGASVFTDNNRHGRGIIGILSNTVSAIPRYPRARTLRFSIITKLTWAKLIDICSKIFPEGNVYDVCPPFWRYSKNGNHLYQHSNAIPY